jgi:uncharacterized repeat protein (TIGR02543 family)
MRNLSKVVGLNLFSLLVSLLVSVQIIHPIQANAVPTQGSIRTASNAGVQFGTQNTALTPSFTIEAWWKWADGVSPSGSQLLLGGSGTPGIYTTGSNSLKLTRWGGGYDSPNCTLQNSFVAGSWYHLAIGRSSGGLVTVWLNGSPLQNCSKITVAPFTNLGTQFPSFFGGNGAGALFDGFFANYRATSTDIYGAADALGFQPNSNFYTSITGTINLLNTPNDGASVFSDSIGSPTGFISHTGGTLSSEFPTYTPQSICFDGTQSKYFNTETIGTGDFTAELWVKPTVNVRYESFIDLGLNRGGSYLGYDGDGGNRIMFYDGGLGGGDKIVPLNTWTHIAVVRSSTLLKMFVNGTEANRSANHNKNFTYTKVHIGSYGQSVANYIGCMASVRVVKSAVYSANFTPASVGSFPALPNAVSPLVSLLAGGNALYNSGTAGSVQGTGTLSYEALQISQSVLTMNAASGTYGSTTTLATTGGSGSGAVSFDVVSGNCSVAGDVLSATSAGNCVVTATKASDATYSAITSAQSTIVIGKKSEIFSYSISSNTGTFTYGATYTVSMTFPAGAVAGNGGWNVLKASTAWGVNGAGDVVCNGATVSAAGTYTCSFNSAAMWPNAQVMAISGLHVRFNGSNNFNSFNQDTVGTKISIAGCDYVFCPSRESVTVTATNKTISFGTNLGGVGFETPYGETGGQLRYTITNGANGATKAWGVSCTSTYTTGAAVGTYPITCSGTTRPTGAPNPVTDEWVVANTSYSTLYNANADNFLYTLKNPRVYTSAANWWKRGSFYTSDTYQYVSFVQGTLTVNPLTLTAPTPVTASAVANNSTSIRISFIQSAYASSHTALVFASNGTTLLKTVPSYESGTAITGLDPNTAYKVSVKALGDGSNSADSSPSVQASVTTNINYSRTISYSSGAGATGTIPSAEVKLTNETITVGSDSGFTKTGYTFAHWSNGISSFAPGSIFTVGATDETLTAQWTLNSYVVTFNANGGTGGTTATVNYNENAIASAPTVSKSQYIFAGWAETVTASSIVTWTVVGTKTLYSLWTPKIYSITYNAESGTALTALETFTVGSSPIQLQSATRAGYKFNGWFTDKTGGSLLGITGTNFTPTDTATVHAQWTQASLVGLSNPTSFGTIIATSGNDGGISATRSGTKAEIDYFADSLPINTVITAYLQGSTAYAASQLAGVTNLLLSVVVAWKAPDETVPIVDPSKNAIRLKITNPDIKRGAKVYSIAGDSSTILTTATQDGFVVIELREDPEIVIANPVEVPAPPAPAPPAITAAPVIDNSAAEKEAKLKLEEEAKKAAELKAAQEQAAKDLQAAREKAEADIKAAQDAADAAAKLKAEADARLAAELKAKEDAAIAANLAAQKIVPDVTLYSISSTLKLSVYDSAYLKKYVATLKPKATVTCIGYIYPKNTTLAKAKQKATSQATAICKLIKAQRKTLTTKVVIYPASKAPKAAAGAKWVAVSYRVDGFKS